MTESLSIPAMHRETFLKALDKGKTVAGAAALLGVSEKTVRRWKEREGMKPKYYRRKKYNV